MVDSSKFARFIEKAANRLEQIKQSLLKHEKNPNDREFLNDIFRSVHAIKNSAMPAGFGRISELCYHLENFLQRIRQDRIKIDQEKIEILVEGKDRLSKLIHDIETTDKERATVKDLIKRIQQEMEVAPEAAMPEPAPVPEVLTPEPVPAPEPLTPALESLPAEPFAEEEEGESSLLPDEIRNEEYDRELFQIFIEQMQENLSLLRALANGYVNSANKGKIISLCSYLAGKLQTSANYMGYDRLADYFLQWVAELELAGVDLTMGTPVSFDFMDERIKTITGLFPQVKDTPASTAAVQKAEGEMVPPQPVVRKPPEPGESEDTLTFKDLFSDMNMGAEEDFAEAAEPLAALSGFELQEEKHSTQPSKGTGTAARKNRIKLPPVAIDATFLEEERQSPEFDEELFQIFVQQLQENLSELRDLVDSYPGATNKATIVNQCSTLVGKLQASANYMGYERLAEYYLQWIAELEMAGVDLSLGTPVSFAFMDERIREILEVFPQARHVSAPVTPVAEPEFMAPPPPSQKPPEKEPDESESFKELFRGMEVDEEEIFQEDSAPVAALTGFAEKEGWREPVLAAEADLPEVDNFFGDLEEETPALAQKPAPSPAAASEVADLFGEGEDALAPEPVAALAGIEKTEGWQESRPAKEVALPEVDDFFNAFGVELPDLTQKPAPPPTAPAAPAFDDMEDLFAEAVSTPAPEPMADMTGAGEIAEEQEAAPVEEAALSEADNFFGEFAEGEEEPFEIGMEPIAALTGEEFAEPEPAKPARRTPAKDIETLLLDEKEIEPGLVEKMAEDIENLLAASAGGDDLDFEIEDESLAALGDSPAADLLLQDKVLAPRPKITEPVEDIASLFGEEEEETFPAPEEPAPTTEAVPPERQELFRKLSHALKSLEAEVPTLEAAVDRDRVRAARPVSETPASATAKAEEEDRKLFARLFGALESTAVDDDRGAAKPIDQVIEEILAAEEEIQSAPKEPVPREVPVQITALDFRQKFGLDAERMNSLMDQVGELATSRSSLSQLYQEMSSLRHQLQEKLDLNELTPLQNLQLRLEDTTSALNRVSSEIREGILKVRMFPAGQLFSLYQELAGDLARKANRQVELTIRGEDTEIDQFTVEDIGDCLLHLISNAVRHGIESVEERLRLGKNASGALTLNACHEGSHVVVEVADDGRGIDPKIIKATALARNLLSGDELYRMSDQDLTRLIMTPGFTTKAGMTADPKVPGLDRVKAIMDKLGGTVQIKSKVGHGTLVRLLIPLKLPTIQALKVRAGTEIFVLPLSAIEEIVRVTPENLTRKGDAESITFRNENIPLHSLDRIAGLEALAPHGTRFPVVVIKSDAGLAGLIVDEIIGLDEVAVKPLAEYLCAHRDFAGAAIKGDGDFSFIPDVAGLMKTATGAARI